MSTNVLINHSTADGVKLTKQKEWIIDYHFWSNLTQIIESIWDKQ